MEVRKNGEREDDGKEVGGKKEMKMMVRVKEWWRWKWRYGDEDSGKDNNEDKENG